MQLKDWSSLCTRQRNFGRCCVRLCKFYLLRKEYIGLGLVSAFSWSISFPFFWPSAVQKQQEMTPSCRHQSLSLSLYLPHIMMMCLHGLPSILVIPHCSHCIYTLGFTNHHRAVRSVAEEIDVAANAMKFRSVGRNQIDQVANMLQCFSSYRLCDCTLGIANSCLLTCSMQIIALLDGLDVELWRMPQNEIQQ